MSRDYLNFFGKFVRTVKRALQERRETVVTLAEQPQELDGE